jgi:hypoxanthine phosphoribosyltransferase
LTLPVIVPAEELEAGVRRLAGELSEAYADGVVLVAVLKGSVPFLADLVRMMTISPVVDFLAISAYGESGRVRLVKDLDLDIHDRDVVLVEDIVDTGLTLAYLVGELRQRGPRSLEVCTLLDKQVRRIVPTPIRFVGFEIEDRFVLGYGLDFAERYRNVPAVVEGDVQALVADPGAHVVELYGR